MILCDRFFLYQQNTIVYSLYYGKIKLVSYRYFNSFNLFQIKYQFLNDKWLVLLKCWPFIRRVIYVFVLSLFGPFLVQLVVFFSSGCKCLKWLPQVVIIVFMIWSDSHVFLWCFTDLVMKPAWGLNNHFVFFTTFEPEVKIWYQI